MKPDTATKLESLLASVLYSQRLLPLGSTLVCSTKKDGRPPSHGRRNTPCLELVRITRLGRNFRQARAKLSHRTGNRMRASAVHSMGRRASFLENVPSGTFVSATPSEASLLLNSPSDHVLVTA